MSDQLTERPTPSRGTPHQPAPFRATLHDRRRVLVARLVDDHVDGAFAWGARAPDEPGAPLVASARYRRDGEDPATAEVAVVVIEGWRRIGLGRLLLETLLVSAAQHGIRRLIAHVERRNAPAERLLRRSGFRTVAEVNGVSLRMEATVSGDSRTLMSSNPILRAG
jgi:GNAT superfamily N-acetyltransferase